MTSVTWVSLAEAKDIWPDALLDDAALTSLLSAAEEQLTEYVPTLAATIAANIDESGYDVPARVKQALILHTRDLWRASARDGDAIGFGEGDQVVRVQPMSATVRSLLRPRTTPVFG